MSLLKKLFGSKEEPIQSNDDFWNWFQQNAESFFKVVKEQGDFEKHFFNKLSPKLRQLREGYYFLTGMADENTAELILTPDGALTNIVFVEELVASAPKIANWKFTALKPAIDVANVNIQMGNLNFNKDNLSFYYNEDPNFPDEIKITVIHNDFTEKDKEAITNGTYIFLDNFLGELNFITTIDKIKVSGKESGKELISIEKLKDFLVWREKEFIEKYDGIRHNTENDRYSILEAKLSNGNPLLATVNTDLLHWDSKASHPWILNIEVKFVADENGMPLDDIATSKLDELEDDLLLRLKDSEGYLLIGRETANGSREIYFACKDFRKPCKVMEDIIMNYEDRFEIAFDIYKDKYWQSFNRYVSN